MGYFAECRQFLFEYRYRNRDTGSILPSSRPLARALTRPLRQSSPPRRILESGPGTGAVTNEILQLLRPGDRLEIVELNANFHALLQRRFETEPIWRKARPQVTLIHGPLQEQPGEAEYDFIVSGVPHMNLPLPLVSEIFASYQRLLKPEGTLSYFEYLWLRHIKRRLVGQTERNRLSEVGGFLDETSRRCQVGSEDVYFNVPPAAARHLCFSKPGDKRSESPGSWKRTPPA